MDCAFIGGIKFNLLMWQVRWGGPGTAQALYILFKPAPPRLTNPNIAVMTVEQACFATNMALSVTK